eukprot:55828_1
MANLIYPCALYTIHIMKRCWFIMGDWLMQEREASARASIITQTHTQESRGDIGSIYKNYSIASARRHIGQNIDSRSNRKRQNIDSERFLLFEASNHPMHNHSQQNTLQINTSHQIRCDMSCYEYCF